MAKPDNLLGVRKQLDKAHEHITQLGEQLQATMATRETILRTQTIIEAQAIHQQEQNTLLREVIARLVELHGVDAVDGGKRLVITRDATAKIDLKYGLQGDQALELAVDVDEVGMTLRIKERPRLVPQTDEPVSVTLGDHGDVVKLERVVAEAEAEGPA